MRSVPTESLLRHRLSSEALGALRAQTALLIQPDRYTSCGCPVYPPKKSRVKSPSSRKLQHTLPFCSQRCIKPTECALANGKETRKQRSKFLGQGRCVLSSCLQTL